MKQVTGIKAISFDGDATLWDFEKLMRHSLSFTLDELHRRFPRIAATGLTIDDWLNRSGVENSTPVIPDHEIESLAELPAIAGTYGKASNNQP